MTQTLISCLSELDVDVELIDRRFSRSIDEVGRISARKFLVGPSFLWRTLVSMLVFKPHICVLFSTNRTLSLIADTLATLIVSSRRTPIVTYVHTSGYTDIAKRGALQRFCVRTCLGKARAVVVLGSSLISDVREFAPASIRVIPNAIKDPRIASRPRESVLFLSNLLPEKGIDDFVALAEHLAPDFPHTPFHIVGPETHRGQLESLRERVSRAPHGSNIHVLGPLYDNDKWQAISGSRLLIFPSRYHLEAQPVTIIEALSVGVPVLAYDIGGIRDIVKPGKSGLMVDAGDIDALCAAARSFLEQPQDAHGLEEGARDQFIRSHSVESYGEAWLSLIEELINA
jgi:glycosyltransferase involved in cell wall biosynthesis